MLITGGAGVVGSTLVDTLVPIGPAEIVVLDDFSRGLAENLASARRLGPVTVVVGDVRDRELVDSVTRGIDVVFHQAAIRLPHCAADPRLALEVMVDGTFNVVDAARRSRRREDRRRVVGVDLRRGHHVPDRGDPRPVRQPHAVRRGQDVRRGTPAQLPRDLRLRLSRAAVLQRVRSAHGRPHRVHRGAGAVDATDRRRSAAGDRRGRSPDDGLRLRRRRRARQRARRDQRRDRRCVQRRERRRDVARRARPCAPRTPWAPTSRWSTALRARCPPSSGVWPVPRRPGRARVHGRGRSPRGTRPPGRVVARGRGTG